jgi:glutamate synthase (NADPH/NADH) small chain
LWGALSTDKASKASASLCLASPAALLGDKGSLEAVRCQKMKLGEPVQMAVIALWTSAYLLVQATTSEVQTKRKGCIAADPDTVQTSKQGVFAAGDTVTGSATVILAMAAGRKAARSIRDYLTQPRDDGPALPIGH